MRPVARDTTIMVVDAKQEVSQGISGDGSAVVMRLRKSMFQHLLRRFERTVQSNVQVYRSYNEANQMLLGAIRQRILRAKDRDSYVGVLQRYQNAVRMLPLQCDQVYVARRARQVDYAQAKKDLMRESSVLLNSVRRTLHSQRSYCMFLRALYALADAAFVAQQAQEQERQACSSSGQQNGPQGEPQDKGTILAGRTQVTTPPKVQPELPPPTLHEVPRTRERSRPDSLSSGNNRHSPRGTNDVVRCSCAGLGTRQYALRCVTVRLGAIVECR
jgi:hypothetical protein